MFAESITSSVRTPSLTGDKFTFPSDLPHKKPLSSVAITNPNSVTHGPTRRNFAWPPGDNVDDSPRYWHFNKSPNSAKFGRDDKMDEDLNIYTSFRLKTKRSESDEPERQSFTNTNEQSVELPYPPIYANEVRDEHVLIPGKKVTSLKYIESHISHTFTDPIEMTHGKWENQAKISPNEDGFSSTVQPNDENLDKAELVKTDVTAQSELNHQTDQSGHLNDSGTGSKSVDNFISVDSALSNNIVTDNESELEFLC